MKRRRISGAFFMLLAAVLLLIAPVSSQACYYWSENGHYYEVITTSCSSGITWSQALDAAAMQVLSVKGVDSSQYVAYLATITSSAEQNYISSKFCSDAWIAGSDAGTEGVWKWMAGPEAGQTVSYTNWNNGEPNNFINEDYMELYYTGKWNDLSGSAKLCSYLVEFSLKPVPTPIPAALPLLGSALAALGIMRRKNR